MNELIIYLTGFMYLDSEAMKDIVQFNALLLAARNMKHETFVQQAATAQFIGDMHVICWCIMAVGNVTWYRAADGYVEYMNHECTSQLATPQLATANSVSVASPSIRTINCLNNSLVRTLK